MEDKSTKRERLFAYLKFVDGFFIENNLVSPLRKQPEIYSKTGNKASDLTYKTLRCLTKRTITEIMQKYDILMEKAGKYDLPYTVASDFFFQYLYQKAKFVIVENILTELEKRRRNLSYIHYAFALHYLDKAEFSKRFGHFESSTQRSAFKIITDYGLYRKALEHLRLIPRNERRNASYNFLLASCHAALQEYKSAEKYLDIGRNLGAKDHTLITPRVLQFEVLALQYLAIKHGCDRKFDDMLGLLLRANMIRPNDYLTTCLLAIAYNELKMHRNCIKVLIKYRKSHPNSIHMYESIGQQYLMLGRFYYATLYFYGGMVRCKEQLLRERLEIYYRHAQGMWYVKQRLTDSAKKAFTRSGELVRKYNLQKYRHWTIYADLLEVDNQIELIGHSHNQQDFRMHLESGMERLVDIMQTLGYLSDSKTVLSESMILGKLFMAIKVIREKFYDPFKLLLFSKLFYLSDLNTLYLPDGKRRKAIKLPKFLKKFLNQKTMGNFYNIHKIGCDFYTSQFKNLGFASECTMYIGLKIFTEALGNRTIDQISKEAWPSMIALLRQSSEDIGRTVTLEVLQNMETKIDKLGLKQDRIYEALFPTKEGTTISITKNTIKLLTNVNNEGIVTDKIKVRWISQSVLKERVKKCMKKKYLLWMYYKTGEAFVFGKQFSREIDNTSLRKPATISDSYVKFLEYLLKSNGRNCSYEKLYKHITKNEYRKHKNSRNRINSIIRCLKKYSCGKLNTYIYSKKKEKVRFDNKGYPVCIVYNRK
jgi:tetratricopeptide (TPR) repeat protein